LDDEQLPNERGESHVTYILNCEDPVISLESVKLGTKISCADYYRGVSIANVIDSPWSGCVRAFGVTIGL